MPGPWIHNLDKVYLFIIIIIFIIKKKQFLKFVCYFHRIAEFFLNLTLYVHQNIQYWPKILPFWGSGIICNSLSIRNGIKLGYYKDQEFQSSVRINKMSMVNVAHLINDVVSRQYIANKHFIINIDCNILFILILIPNKQHWYINITIHIQKIRGRKR